MLNKKNKLTCFQNYFSTAYQITLFIGLILTTNLSIAANHALANQNQQAESSIKSIGLSTKFSTHLGDFDSLLKRHMIRVAIPYSRTLFFNDNGVQRGLTAENIRDFERWINKKYKTDARPITVYAIPTTRDKLFESVMNGQADIAAGNITVTEHRQTLVDFTNPVLSNVSQRVIRHPNAPNIQQLSDLSGKTVHIRKLSSHHDSLTQLSAQFLEQGKAEINIVLLPDTLEDEDIIDLLAAGVIDISVLDSWIADLWRDAHPELHLKTGISIRTGDTIAWAIRKNSPQLINELNDYIAQQQTSRTQNASSRIASYHRQFKNMKNPKNDTDWKNFEVLVEHFKDYANRYQFDYLMSVAQGFQESELNQSARSPDGAIGIMQLMPKTGIALGVGDISRADANIHGGIKYMRQLLDKHFSDAHFDDTNAALFAFAAYNAGPYKLAKLRKEAQKSGLDPNKWFNNVELVVSEKLGQGPVRYVRNIYKYYVAYKLELEVLAAHEKARATVSLSNE